MDPTQEECEACPLYMFTSTLQVPEGGELAWMVYQKLSGPAVSRFGLHQAVIELIGIDTMNYPETVELIDDLNAICQGENEAQIEIDKSKKPTSK